MALVRRWSVPGWVRFVSTIVLSLYSAFVGLVLVLDKQLKPATWKWVHSTVLIVWLVGILAGLTLTDNVRRAILRYRATGHEGNRVEIRNQMGALIIAVAQIHGISAGDIGCGLFLRQERWVRRPARWFPCPKGFLRPERLKRIERMRLPDNVPESTVEFTKGKGAVGACWEHGQHGYNDWRSINRRYQTPDDVVSRWSKMRDETKHGFDQKEFISLIGKYAEVVAMPIIINGSFEGCIAIDRKWNKESASDRSLLNDDATKRQLGAAAQTLVPSLRKG